MAKNIKETFATQLATGKVVITEILDTNNPDQKRIEVAQLVKGDAPNLIGILQKTKSRFCIGSMDAGINYNGS